MQDEHIDHGDQSEVHAKSPVPDAAPGAAQGKSTWPIVLGIIALVFGLAGFLSNMWGIATPFFLEGLMSSMAGELGGEAEETVRATWEITRAWSNWLIGFGLLAVVVSGLLLVGGIMLLRRRAAAVPLLKLWAGVRMVTAIVGAYVGLQIQRQTFAALEQTMGAEMDQVPAGLLGATATFGTIFSVLFGWALPVIVLIWFSRQAIKDEVNDWM